MKTWIVLCLGSSFLLNGAELEWNMEKPWQQDGGVYSLSYEGKGWPALTRRVPVLAGKFYRLVWEDRLTGGDAPKWQVFFRRGGKNMGGDAFPLSAEWTSRTVYFYSGKDGELEHRFAPDPGKAGQISIRGFVWEELSPEQLRSSLLPNGNFESASAGAGFWKDLNWKNPVPPVKLVRGQQFLNGETSLEMILPKREKSVFGIQSRSLPMEPGRTYLFSFWAKADVPMGITAAVSIWAPSGHRGKHSNQTREFKIETDWKRYDWEVAIPFDAAKYPDLVERMGSLVFMTRKAGQTGTLWLDDILFRHK